MQCNASDPFLGESLHCWNSLPCLDDQCLVIASHHKRRRVEEMIKTVT